MSFLLLCTLVFEMSLINLELTDFPRVAGQEAPEIFRSLSPQLELEMCIAAPGFFFVTSVLGIQTQVLWFPWQAILSTDHLSSPLIDPLIFIYLIIYLHMCIMHACTGHDVHMEVRGQPWGADSLLHFVKAGVFCFCCFAVKPRISWAMSFQMFLLSPLPIAPRG